MGIDVRTAAQSFGFFLGSVKGTNLTLKESREIFAGFTTAARALQLSTQDVDGVFRALGQMMSKGKIQAEELRGQLGDRLPGAFARFAVALHMTRPGELDQALKKGTITADKMKNAILDVAHTLSTEFGPSAAQMAKTVDSAFNRMKNAFTFAAGDLGKSGLNQALIEIMNTATKLLQSNALDTILRGLGGAFKFIGDHINLFVTIIGTIALSSTLKWAASLLDLTKIMRTFMALQAAEAIAQLAVATGDAAVAAGSASKAMTLLNAVMRENPWILAATAIVAVVAALKLLSNSAADTLEEIAKNSNSMADTESIYQQYITNVMSSTGALDEETRAFRENTVAAINNARTKLGQVNLKEGTVHPLSARDFLSLDVHKVQSVHTIGGEQVSDRVYNIYKEVFDRQGNYRKATNQQEFLRRVQLGAFLSKYKDKPGFEGADQISQTLDLDVTTARDKAAMPGGVAKLGYDPNAALSQNKYTRGWEMQRALGAGISGAMIPKPDKKKKHGKSDAEKAQDDINSAIDQAMNGLTDLETRAKATADNVAELLSGSFDKAGAAAHLAAAEQEKSFEDAIKGSENKVKGVLQLAQQLGLDTSGKTIADQYRQAKAGLIDYFEERQRAAAEAKKDESVVTDIIGMRADNENQRNYIDILRARKVGLADANRQLEIENALVGTSLENRPKLQRQLEQELITRDALKLSLQAVNEQRDLENQLAQDQALIPLYKAGAKPEDLDYYKEMLRYRQEIYDLGARGTDLDNMIKVHAATLNEARAMKELSDQYEKANQTAADMADAIVGGFRDGMEAGDTFLDTFKNIFKQLSKIILDFVLFNPIKQWLQQSLAQTLAPQSTAGYGGVGSPLSGTVNSYSTGGGFRGALSTILGGVGSPQLPAIGTSSQYKNGFSRDAGGYLYAGGTQSSGSSYPYGNIVVTGKNLPSGDMMNSTIPVPNSARPINVLSNLSETLKASQAGFKDFTSFLKGGKGVSAGKGISGAIGAAGTAFAMYEMGHQIGRTISDALGLKGKGGNVLSGAFGGAAAGYSLGGPIGAAIGAVAGGILGLFQKVAKLPASYGSVVVGANGVANVGTVGHYGKGTDAAGQTLNAAGAKLFNSFATNYGAQLNPGNFGYFGSKAWTKKGSPENFYSTVGITNHGWPMGTEGVDWIKGNDSQIQAFAILAAFKKGLIKGLSDTLQTVLKNTQSKDMEGLQGDLAVGQAFDEFIKASFKLPDAVAKIRDLNEAFYKLKSQAASLGLSEDKLVKARQRLINQVKDDFNYGIQQGILGYTNPALAQFNDLRKDYHDAVQTAMAVGGDLAAVEDLYGRKRVDLAKQWADTAANGLISAAKDLYDQLTASSSSPLNTQTVFGNARDLYSGLTNQFSAGDFTNVDKLSGYAQNYLDAARQMYGSSTDYFDVFKQVTDQLTQFQTPGSSSIGGVAAIPDLPTLNEMVQEINSSSLDMIDAMGTVGQAVVEGSTNIVDAINNLAIALGYQIPAAPPSSPTPTGPTAGGTGVNETGGAGGRGRYDIYGYTDDFFGTSMQRQVYG
jgi:tape measure domain-containing protein